MLNKGLVGMVEFVSLFEDKAATWSQYGPYILAYTLISILIKRRSSLAWRFITSKSQARKPFLDLEVITSQFETVGEGRGFSSLFSHAAEGYLIDRHIRTPFLEVGPNLPVWTLSFLVVFFCPPSQGRVCPLSGNSSLMAIGDIKISQVVGKMAIT